MQNTPRTRLALAAITLGIVASTAAPTPLADEAPGASTTVAADQAGVTISGGGRSERRVALGEASPRGHRPAAGNDPVALEVRDASPFQEEILRWAIARSDEAGLTLPPLVVSFHSDRADCGGQLGTLGADGDRFRVKTCAAGGQVRQNLLHELAHAWDRGGGIPLTMRGDFLTMRGLDDWRNPTDDWSRRGAEHTAEIVAWGLEVAQWDIPSAIADVGPQDTDSLRAAFQFLTGHTPLWDIDGN